MDDQLPPISSVIPGTGAPVPVPSGPPVPFPPSPAISPMPPPPIGSMAGPSAQTPPIASVPAASPVQKAVIPPAHNPVVPTDSSFTKKQIFFIVGLGVLGLALGAGTAYLLNTLGIRLVGN